MLLSIALMLVSFALLLVGAFVFTNAVEWAGLRLDLGHGAVGSVLAAVATAMPESLIPIVAIISGEQGGEVAIGAIIGAPFLLGTLAMAIVGLSAVVFRAHREQGRDLEVDRRTTVRDLAFFMGFFALAVVLGAFPSRTVHVLAAVLFVLAYIAYLWRTLAHQRGKAGPEKLTSLFFDPSKHDPPHTGETTDQRRSRSGTPSVRPVTLAG